MGAKLPLRAKSAVTIDAISSGAVPLPNQPNGTTAIEMALSPPWVISISITACVTPNGNSNIKLASDQRANVLNCFNVEPADNRIN